MVSHEKCAGVHKGMPMVYFGSYMYRSVAIIDFKVCFSISTFELIFKAEGLGAKVLISTGV